MNAVDGTGNGHGATGNGQGPDAALASARPLLLVRYRPGVTAETGRTVHLVPLPEGGQPGALSALCGVLLRPEQVEQVRPGSSGAPCEGCTLSHALTLPATEPPAEPEASGSAAMPETGPTGWNPQWGPAQAGAAYQRWGWPVTLRRNQVWLNLATVAVALLIPITLACHVVPILDRRRCPPLALTHPATPEHWVLLGSDPYPVPLDWPDGVHRIATQMLLPPTVTPHGPLSWVAPPHPDGLRLTREIDIRTAIHAAQHTPPPDAPTAF